jgi:asparagine synthase (glutamine-hydrolysing)
MCGVIAALAPGDLRERVAAGLAALAHRGPDGRGTWHDPAAGVALGHARLAVVDAAGGAQPVADETGALVAVVNGEIYDDDHHRAWLAAKGHRLRSRSDSELIVHLYAELGLDCLRVLRGELAFVLWDARARRLVAARDRFGIKPLVYAHRDGELWLASEAKALAAAGLSLAWDAETLRQIFAHQYPASTRTLFRGVSELPPGHVLVADDRGVQIAPYWDPGPRPQVSYAPGDDAVDASEIRDVLDDAVRVRLRADVPIAAYLSGGLDSSAVVALAARRAPIAAFGIAFDDPAYDEHRDAAELAHELRIGFTPVPVTSEAILAHLADAVHHAEGLCINGQLSAKYLLARAVRAAGYKVVLAGEGADELFYGYAHLVHDHLAAAGTLPPDFAARYPLQAGVMLGSAATAEPAFVHAKRAIGARLAPLLAPELGPPTEDAFELASPRVAACHPTDRAAHVWTRLALAKYILRTLGDGTEMAHAIEGRLPLLDHRLHELARRCHPDRHLAGGVAKRLLRAALVGVVPERIRTREKRPLLAPPIAASDAPHVRAWCREAVRGEALRALPFDRARVIAWVDGLPALPPDERRAAEPALMLILSACAAQDRFRPGAPA